MATQSKTLPQILEAPATLWRVGETPLVPLQRVTDSIDQGVHVLAKAEWLNPSGSVKDRAAAAILRQALSQGKLSDGRALLDSTSGNMGIAYATLGASLGVRTHLALPANASPERMAMLRALGAELTLTDPTEGSDGARVVAAQMASEAPERFYYADQYSHPANWQAHYQTTGPEVLAQTDGRVTHFIAGLGTTGTVTGAGRFLHERLPGVRVVGVQPATPLHGLEGLKHLPSSPVPPIYDPTVPDEIVEVETEEAYDMARRLARAEGLLVGVSSAAAMVAALRVAALLKQGLIVVLFPDSGLKYLTQGFWRGA